MKLNRYIFILLSVGAAYGQNYTKACSSADTLFPDADKVILSKVYHLQILPDQDSIKFISENEEVTYIRKNSRLYGTESVFYSSEFSKITDLEGSVYNLSTKKKSIAGEASEGVYFSSNIFYDDNRVKYFLYPDIEDKVVTSFKYTINYYDPHLIPPYYFSFSEPVLFSQFRVTVPEGCEIGWVVVDQKHYKVDFEEKKLKGKKEYSWTIKNSEILEEATRDVAVAKVLPHVIVWVKQYRVKDKERMVLRDLNDLYGWYHNFVEQAKTRDTAIIDVLSDSIVRNKTTDIEKADAIFSWVQNNISYVAFEDGYSGFIPRRADDVVRKKYGDCKDMANLIVELMRSSGLDARHVWIGTRDIPYTYHDIFTPIVDNHMIAAVKLADEFYFLDATGKFMPFGFPTSMIQGKIGLIEDGKDFILMQISNVQPSKNLITDSVSLSIVKDQLQGSGIYRLHGYPMIDTKYAVSYKDNNTIKTFLKETLLKGNNKFKLKNYNYLAGGRDTSSVSIDYTFDVNDYLSSNGNEVFVNLNLTKTDLKSLDSDKKINKSAYTTNEYSYIKNETYILNLSNEFNLEYMPSNLTIDKDFIKYNSSYTHEGDKIVYSRKLVINFLELSEDQLKEFNNCLIEIQKQERGNVLLKRKN